jgi:hypothetical protein
MTSVGYGGRYPKSSVGKMIAITAAIFGAFYMAMPLTIIGSTFYEIYVDQEDRKKKIHAKLKLRTAAFNLAKKTSFFKIGNEFRKISSGYEKLCHSLTMRESHASVIDEYINLTRDDIHKYNSKTNLLKFREQHHRVTEILSLYLHTENESEVARQHLHLANIVASGDNNVALTAFKQASAHLKDLDDI